MLATVCRQLRCLALAEPVSDDSVRAMSLHQADIRMGSAETASWQRYLSGTARCPSQFLHEVPQSCHRFFGNAPGTTKLFVGSTGGRSSVDLERREDLMESKKYHKEK